MLLPKDSFLRHIAEKFKALPVSVTEPLVSENLLSPFVVELPKSVLADAQSFVKEIFHLRKSKEYKHKFTATFNDPGNNSILMSYDFHWSSEAGLKLIEVNTNAAFFALSYFMYKSKNVENPISNFSLELLKQDIQCELKLFGKKTEQPRIAIIDENPPTQRLYIEFLAFSELFKSWGWPCEILDYRKLSKNFDFVYNRFTDFYFSQADSEILKNYYNNKDLCFSPHPLEYFYLADKQRMIDWQNLISAEAKKILPFCSDLTASNAEEIWSKRKNLFFKPKQSFGSKQSYKGASVSKRVFDEIVSQNFIAQEYVPAGEQIFANENFKFDLRFYAYQDKVESIVARLYQGQVTNLKTPLGGFACVKLV